MASRKTATSAASGASSTRSASISKYMKPGTDPVDPGSRSATPVAAQIPAPTSPLGARGLLYGQRLLDKKSAVVTAATLSSILTSISKRSDVGETAAALIDSVTLLLPEAIALGGDQVSAISALSEKIDNLVEQGFENGELPTPTDPSEKLLEIEGKLEALTKIIEQSQASAGAAENAAVETQKSLMELHQGMNWDTAPARGKRGAVFPGQPEPETGAQTEHAGPQVRPVPVKQAVASVKRAQAQGTWIIIQPTSTAVADNLSTLSARSLVTKAETAFDIAWKALALTSDFKNMPRPRMNFTSARILVKGGIRYDLADRAQAAFLSDARVAKAFEKAFGDVSCTGQGASILLQCAPVSWTPEDPEALRSLERENQLESGAILSAAWVKPIHRRKPEQRQAVAKIWFRSQKVADDLIIYGGQLECAPVLFRIIRPEPDRCLKCQFFGHKAVKCRALGDTCSGCGGPHRSKDCTDRMTKRCVSCKADDHSSWERSCPSFRAECERFKQRRPESANFLFDSTREDELAAPRPRAILRPSTATLEDALPAGSGWPNRPVWRQDLRSYLTTNRRPAWIGRDSANARKPLDQFAPWNNGRLTTAPLQHPPHMQITPRSPPLAAVTTPPHSPALAPVDRYSPSQAPMPEKFPLRRLSISSDSSISTIAA